jgi:hypothetical protein
MQHPAYIDAVKIRRFAGTLMLSACALLATAGALSSENSHIPGQTVAFSGPRDLAAWLPDR